MSSDLGRAARVLVVPTLALVAVLALLPGRAGLAARVYALVLCGVAVAIALSALRRVLPPETPLFPRRSRPAPPESSAALVQLEVTPALGGAGAFTLHYRLRPRLRALAAELLASRRGIALDEQPEAARLVLGDTTWELVRNDRPSSRDRPVRGLDADELTEVVESLERI